MTNIHNVQPETLSQWLEADEAVLVDVREPAEYRAESIDHARNLPLSQVTIDDAHMPEHRHKKLVIHCQSGKRSMMACEKLKEQNAPYDIWNLQGGIIAWKASGLPVTVSGKNILPLDRQVQLTIGLMIVLGMILGHNVSYGWFILPLIAGLGLMNAGITGWCGLAKLIAKMPWNQG